MHGSKNTQREIFAFNIKTVLLKKLEKPKSGNKFWNIFEKKLLYAYKENKLNGEISTTSVYISVNNNTNLIFFRFVLFTLYGMDKAKKPSHATVPLSESIKPNCSTPSLSGFVFLIECYN